MTIIRVLFQTVVLALGQIWANKTRAMLTALGIIIGVSSVIAVIAGLSGLKGFVLKEFESFGANSMWVWGNVPEDLRTTMSWTDVKMSIHEMESILQHCESIQSITPIMDNRYDVEYGDVIKRGVTTTGIWPSWHEITDRSVIRGRQFTQTDADNALQVCLINELGIEEFNLDTDPVGEFIRVKGRRFLVIGVVETKELKIFGNGQAQTELFIPYETQYALNPYRWCYMQASMTDPDKADEAREEVRFVMRNLRGLEPGDVDTFEMQILQNVVDQFNAMASGITVVAVVVVCISLLVGGIGIMNIMLVSVSERTREIGLRKAVGARPSIILMQFLVEAVTLCFVGGLIGYGIGQSLAILMAKIPDSPLGEASVPPWAVILALGFSASVGVIFGMFPAIKAARLNPIDALRHE